MQYYISHYNKEPELNFPDEITVYDTTLRDGEQTPGVCFSPEEKLEIAKKLDEVKIKQIEAGSYSFQKRTGISESHNFRRP